MVEVAEVLAAEGGGAAAVVVGEEVVAGGAILCGHGVASTPLGRSIFGRKVLKGKGMSSGWWQSERAGSGFKCKGPGPARTARVSRGCPMRGVPGCDGFGSTSIVASGVG
jgi:hypothetical protein